MVFTLFLVGGQGGGFRDDTCSQLFLLLDRQGSHFAHEGGQGLGRGEGSVVVVHDERGFVI